MAVVQQHNVVQFHRKHFYKIKVHVKNFPVYIKREIAGTYGWLSPAEPKPLLECKDITAACFSINCPFKRQNMCHIEYLFQI